MRILSGEGSVLWSPITAKLLVNIVTVLRVSVCTLDSAYFSQWMVVFLTSYCRDVYNNCGAKCNGGYRIEHGKDAEHKPINGVRGRGSPS